jgi:hypothetical protein
VRQLGYHVCQHLHGHDILLQVTLPKLGVDKDYISAQMGHVEGSSTTDNYVNRFGYKLMVEYNSKLLHNDSKTSLLAALQALSADERESLLAMVGGR